MILVSATMEVSGPARDVIVVGHTANKANARVSVLPSVSLRCPWKARSTDREQQFLPRIEGGSAAAALRKIDEFHDKSRLSNEEYAEAKSTIEQLASLTK